MIASRPPEHARRHTIAGTWDKQASPVQLRALGSAWIDDGAIAVVGAAVEIGYGLYLCVIETGSAIAGRRAHMIGKVGAGIEVAG